MSVHLKCPSRTTSCSVSNHENVSSGPILSLCYARACSAEREACCEVCAAGEWWRFECYWVVRLCGQSWRWWCWWGKSSIAVVGHCSIPLQSSVCSVYSASSSDTWPTTHRLRRAVVVQQPPTRELILMGWFVMRFDLMLRCLALRSIKTSIYMDICFLSLHFLYRAKDRVACHRTQLFTTVYRASNTRHNHHACEHFGTFIVTL